MQHRSSAYRTLGHPTGSAVLTLGLVALSGCLVPLPLQQQNSVDGGQLLMVTAAVPPFGTQVATTTTDLFTYTLDVVSDSPSLAARLYGRVDGTCCELNFQPPNSSIRFFQQAQVTRLAQDPTRYSVEFNNQVPPCQQGQPPGSTTFIIPVLASGGFLPNSIGPDGVGIVDSSHYWTVRCP